MNKRITKILMLSLFLMSYYGCSSTADLYTYTDLHESIEQKFNDAAFAHAHWGVLIESLETGKVLYERNADRMFMPASNQKIPTAASGLISLGPDFVYETDLYYSGEIVDSILKGDLIIKGSGDPTFYTRFFDDPREPFFNWADSLLKLGIKHIEGNIIGDDNAFDDNHLGMGWAHDNLDSWYSAEFGALQFNENYIDLKIIPPAVLDDSVQIIPNVQSDYYSIINNITVTDTGKSSLKITRPFNSNVISVSGNLPTGSRSIERSPSIHNPTLFYVTVLKETLINKGISVSGKALDCDDLMYWNLDLIKVNKILTHNSPQLLEILKILMKNSQNLYAETLVKTMGNKLFENGSFDDGKIAVEDVLLSFGIEPKTYAFNDASGLSRYNFISPNQIVKILKGMRASEYRDIWYEILPIAGIDGTLKSRMKGTPAEGNVKAKTGTISNVRGLSGYLTTFKGEEIVFSFLVNGHLKSSRDTDLITDYVLSMIANYPYKMVEKAD